MKILADQIEKIQKKPEFERRKFFWIAIFALVPLIIILSIWLIISGFQSNTNGKIFLNSNSFGSSLEDLLNNSKKTFLNINGVANDLQISSQTTSPSSSADALNPSLQPEENKVYFISPAPSY